uniref:Uncharacterized protein n=1 Tax=Solibacter usitatus (strain Ellin6076) TaxID=234267 RepID=Q02BL5_SOLUE
MEIVVYTYNGSLPNGRGSLAREFFAGCEQTRAQWCRYSRPCPTWSAMRRLPIMRCCRRRRLWRRRRCTIKAISAIAISASTSASTFMK